MVGRSAVSLGLTCDGACVFCAQKGLPGRETPADVLRTALEQARGRGDAVTFVGGEPAVSPALEDAVGLARSLGFARIGVQTNGWALASPGRVDSLARAGLTDLHLSIHGAEARVHDWHAGRAGAFDAAVGTMASARAAGLDVVVATVLTRSSFRVLGPMPRWLVGKGARAWCIEVPRWRGRAATDADRVVPRLALALPFALHALDAAAALGLPAFVRGAPACLLGPFAARALDDARDHGAPCEGCPSRSSCSGVDREYLARFGDRELSPRDPAPRAVSDLASFFVGVGELADRVDASAVAPPPERARVALPVLGRPAPALKEVAAGTPKQSGEALRAILPGLFAGDRDPPKG
jgi:hypothetical protein